MIFIDLSDEKDSNPIPPVSVNGTEALQVRVAIAEEKAIQARRRLQNAENQIGEMRGAGQDVPEERFTALAEIRAAQRYAEREHSLLREKLERMDEQDQHEREIH